VRLRAAVLALPLALLLTACGGAHHARAVVRITATDLAARNSTVVARPHAHANGREVPLESVLSLVPSPLPPAGTDCTGTGAVTIALSGGATVRYGRCRPRSIELLQLVLTSEARQWSAPPVARTRIVGARAAEARALGGLLHALGPTRISSIGIEPHGAEVRLRVHAGASVRGEWEAALLAGLYTNDAGTHGLRPVGLVAGSDTTLARGFVAQRFSLARVHRRVVAALRGRARIVELRDEGGGLAVVVRTSQPAAFLKLRGRALVAATTLGAHYVGVEDGAGALVYAWGSLPYEGILYPRPDLDSCGPIAHSEPLGAQPPPCPAH